MCSPLVMEKVQAAITRRRLFGLAGATGAAVVLAPMGGAQRLAALQDGTPPGEPTVGATVEPTIGATVEPTVGATAEPTTGVITGPVATPAATPVGPSAIAVCTFANVQDLTHTASPDFPMFPGAQQMQINVLFSFEEGDIYYKNELILDEHTGTHMDAPAHFDENGVSADRLPVERLLAPLAVIDISARVATDEDAQLMPEDILAWEAQFGPLPAGAFVAMHSGWASRVNDRERYINLDASDTQHYPGFHPDATALLVEERNIVGIGVDTASLDFGPSTDFETHITALSAGKYGLENLANLSLVPASGATLVVGGPKHRNASGGPTRALALY